MKIKHMTYTKENGDISNRTVVVISEPRSNYLCYDISGFSPTEQDVFSHYLESIEDYRQETLDEFEAVTGHKVNSLWRSFKPGGIEWETGSDKI